MRVAYLSRGNNVYDRRFLEKMVERGYEPYFISYYNSQRIIVEGVKNFFYDLKTLPLFGRLRLLQKAWHLRKLLNVVKPDILHTGLVKDHGFLGALSGFHPTLSMPWGSDVLIRPYDSAWAMWKTRFTLRRADMITCDCELIKNKIIELSRCTSDKIVVFPWGIDLQNFRPNEARLRVRERLGWKRNKIIIMTRSLEKPLYGHATFLDALPTVVHAEPATKVIFVGRGRLELELRVRIAKLRLQDHVYFAGWADEVTMGEYLNAADIYVSAAISDGTSCSLLEAMACRLPVVVTDAPANLEWVEDGMNGYIFPRRDSSLLAEKIIQLLSDDALREEMGAHNLQIARERADWERNFDKLERIYYSLA